MKLRFCETKNVRAFLTTVQNLMNREAGVPGIALVHGPRGVGKSKTAGWYEASHDDCVYLLTSPIWTLRWLYESLCIELGITPPRGLKQRHDEVVNALVERSRLLIFDECNSLPAPVLDEIRLLGERTETPILLIGHEGIMAKLVRMGPLFDRLLYITEFKPLDREDLAFLAHEILELPIEEAALDSIMKSKGRGRIRPSVVCLTRMETRARNARSKMIEARHFRPADVKAAEIQDKRKEAA